MQRSSVTVDEVGVGSKITLKDLELNVTEELQIVGSTESNPEKHKISDESPIGKAALKKRVGDIIEVEVPIGMIRFEILKISK